MTTIKLKGVNRFLMNEFHDESPHKCNRNYKIGAVSSSLVAKENLTFFKDNPSMHRRNAASYVKEKHNVEITEHQLRRSVKMAKKILHRFMKSNIKC